jgi:protein TonB
LDYTTTALRAYKERRIRLLKGIILSLLLHLLILWLFTTNFKEVTFLPPQKQERKISLNLKQIVTPPPAPKPVITPPIQQPLIQQPMVEKKIEEPTPKQEEVKRVLLDESQKSFAVKSSEENNVTKVAKQPAPKEEKKKIVKKEEKKKPVKKVVKKKTPPKKIAKRTPPKRQPKRSKDPLANMLMGSGSSMAPRPSSRNAGLGSYGEQMIKELYGKEFNTFTSTQKEYIRNNLSQIHRITQHTLTRNGYPTVAIQTKQQGTNVVTFYLHPNGDITGLKLRTRIGYEALDNNTLQVIRLAYKDYPLPNEKTKITFYVRYSMY